MQQEWKTVLDEKLSQRWCSIHFGEVRTARQYLRPNLNSILEILRDVPIGGHWYSRYLCCKPRVHDGHFSATGRLQWKCLGSTNTITAFTTSYARLWLLSTMEKIGHRLLYFDTDSVILYKNQVNRSLQLALSWAAGIINWKTKNLILFDLCLVSQKSTVLRPTLKESTWKSKAWLRTVIRKIFWT